MKCEVVAALCGAPIGSLHYRLKRARSRTTVFPDKSEVSSSNGVDELEYIPDLSTEEHFDEDEKYLIVSPPSEANTSFTGGRTTPAQEKRGREQHQDHDDVSVASDEQIRGLYALLAPTRAVYDGVQARFRDRKLFLLVWRVLMTEWNEGDELVEMARSCCGVTAPVRDTADITRLVVEKTRQKWERIDQRDAEQQRYCHGGVMPKSMKDAQRAELWRVVGRVLVEAETSGVILAAQVAGIKRGSMDKWILQGRVRKILNGYHNLEQIKCGIHGARAGTSLASMVRGSPNEYKEEEPMPPPSPSPATGMTRRNREDLKRNRQEL